MKLFKSKIDWELDGMYIIREECRFGHYKPIKVKVTHLFEKCVEFTILPIPLIDEPKKLLMETSEFGVWGTWHLIEQF